MKPSKALQIMKSVLRGGNSPFLLCGTGVGKSAIVRELADVLADGKEIVIDSIKPTKDQYGFIDFRLSLYESVDLGGLPYIDDNGIQMRINKSHRFAVLRAHIELFETVLTVF